MADADPEPSNRGKSRIGGPKSNEDSVDALLSLLADSGIDGDSSKSDVKVDELDLRAEVTWTDLMERDPDYQFGSDDRALWILTDEQEAVTGVPMTDKASGERQEGLATPCMLGYDMTGVSFTVIEWADGSGEVHCKEITNGEEFLNRLSHGGRLGFYELDDGTKFAELRIMRQGNREYATAHNPAEGEFEDVLGWSLYEFLLEELGVEGVGTREEILGDSTSRKSTPIVNWNRDDVDVPAVLYVATRIFPLMAMDGTY
jgi:hypothetical protein